MGGGCVWKFFIFMVIEPDFYNFLFTKKLNMISERYKVAEIGKYSPRKILMALCGNDTHPIKSAR